MIVSYYLDLPNDPIAFVRTRAVSGTHTACVGVMEQLARNNPDDLFFVCAGPHDLVSPLRSNLFFTTGGIPERTEVLILSTQFGCGSSRPDFAGLSCLKKVIYVGHTIVTLKHGVQLNDFDREILILQDKKIPIARVDLCEWSRDYLVCYVSPGARQILEASESRVIGNPILSDALPPISRLEKMFVRGRRIPNSFLWAATWERGGNVALRVFRKFRAENSNATFHVASYFGIDQLEELKAEPGVVVHGRLGKSALYELMSNVETFVYPLVLPTTLVHKDTFGCCVAEAIACGCRVVTFAQGALKELYSGLVEFADVPPEVQELLSNFELWSCSSWMLSDEAVELLHRAVLRSKVVSKAKSVVADARTIRERFEDARLSAAWQEVVYGRNRPHKAVYYLNIPFDEGGGMSGTHSACKAVVYQIHQSSPTTSCSICTKADEIPNDTDILILSTQFAFPVDPARLPKLKHVVYVTHMTYMHPYAFEIPQLIKMGIKVSIVFLCEWVRSFVRFHLTDFRGVIGNFAGECNQQLFSRRILDTFEDQTKVSHHVIGNPLPPILPPIDPTGSKRIKHSYVYSATWDRGGEFALDVFAKIQERVPAATFHVASYHDSIPKRIAERLGVVVHGSMSKDRLLDLLSVADTMLYPTTAHKDTFACTVNEAIACGCRVVTYAQGALTNIYSGMVEFVKVPAETQARSLSSFYFVEDEWFVSHREEAVEGFARTVLEGEVGPAMRASRALEIRRRFSAESVGRAWLSVVHSL